MGRPKKGENLIILSLRVEKEMLEKLDEMVKDLKTITRTEAIRIALEWCLEQKGFLRNLKNLD